MARQAEYLEEMKRNLTEEQSEVYGEYFERFGEYLRKIFPADVVDAVIASITDMFFFGNLSFPFDSNHLMTVA